jgi:hypothetical protein
MSRFKLSTEKFTSITVPTANGSMGTKVVDMEPCIKVYWSLYEMIDDMSIVEVRLLGYIMSQMSRGSDEVYIDPSDVIKYLNRLRDKDSTSIPTSSKPYIYKGINLLLERRVIAKKSSKVYYINPNMLFKGNRVSVLNK